MDRLKRAATIAGLAHNFQAKHPNPPHPFVKIVEVGPRDGLQNEKEILSLENKKCLIDKLSDAGLRAIEVGAFVSPKWIPQMANSAELYAAINKKEGVSYPCLVPNFKGMQSAVQANLQQIAIFASATQTFSQKNINCSIAESLQRFVPVTKLAKQRGIKVRGYVSMVMGCPYEGEVKPEQVLKVVEGLFRLGCYQVSLGDTIGKGTVQQTRLLCETLTSKFDPLKLAAHFHDTFDTAIPNILTALEYGIRTVDSSVAGLGGCPYSMKPTGNVPTENVLLAVEDAGFKTGVDIKKVQQAGEWVCGILKRKNLAVTAA